jgi:hypothetical protein
MAIIELTGYICADLILLKLGYKKFTKLFIISFSTSILTGIGMIINNPEKGPGLDIALTYI